ncbi:MAG TPA: hypothetical protein VFL69_01610 [Marmoricola sp.]|nr:hypothetical protein [Marmoricola sp.]
MTESSEGRPTRRRGRPSAELVDATPLGGSSVDVGVRIGWLLKMARIADPGRSAPQQRDMVERLAEIGISTSVSSLSRLEAGQRVSNDLLEGYESVLALRPGTLRGPIDALLRTHGGAPIERRPSAPPTLEEWSAAYGQVSFAEPRGIDWLHFADMMALPGVLGLPLELAAPKVERLARELSRSVGVAHLLRYEALAQLRCSSYGDLVLDVVRNLVEDPGTQVLYDLMAVSAERPTDALLGWCGELLGRPTPHVVRGGVIAIETMRQHGGPLDWTLIQDPFAEAFNGAEPWRRALLSHAFRVLPPKIRAALLPRLDHPVGQVRQPMDWTPSRRNLHYNLCQELAREITQRLGLDHQPILARLLFEAIYDFRETRRGNAIFFLAALPFQEVLADAMLKATTSEDVTTREGAVLAVAGLGHGAYVDAARAWVRTDEESLRAAGLMVLAHAADYIVPERMRDLMLQPYPVGRLAMYAVGMCADPLVVEASLDPGVPEEVRRAARWWLANGSRVSS